MKQLLEVLSTASAGTLNVWVGVITGGAVPALSGAVSIASAVVGVTLVVAPGGRLQRLIYRSCRLAKRRERVERVWKRYGMLGFADLAAHGAVACYPPGAGTRCPSPSCSVVDARQRGGLWLCTHRRSGLGISMFGR